MIQPDKIKLCSSYKLAETWKKTFRVGWFYQDISCTLWQPNKAALGPSFLIKERKKEEKKKKN